MTRTESRAVRRLWFMAVISILAIVAIGIVVAHVLPDYSPSPIPVRLAAAVLVTIAVAVAKQAGGPRAAAVTGVAGVLIVVVLLLAFG